MAEIVCVRSLGVSASSSVPDVQSSSLFLLQSLEEKRVLFSPDNRENKDGYIESVSTSRKQINQYM